MILFLQFLFISIPILWLMRVLLGKKKFLLTCIMVCGVIVMICVYCTLPLFISVLIFILSIIIDKKVSFSFLFEIVLILFSFGVYIKYFLLVGIPDRFEPKI